MRLLFCCEFYYPSVGGVQEVMRQLAERMVSRGHDVTVATSRLADRDFTEHNGVRIAEFGVTGNLVRGIVGEVDEYLDFVRDFPCDAIMIKAAQQWTFDALWPVLDQIKARKVFIPCGFSGLYEPTYQDYFRDIPPILAKFDHLIFYAERYRDTDFAKACGLSNLTVLANGASEIEFSVPVDPEFRSRYGIPEDSFVLLTVGSFTGVKGHREVVEAFVRMKAGRRHVTLILNGNRPPSPEVAIKAKAGELEPVVHVGGMEGRSRYATQRIFGAANRAKGVWQREGWKGVHRRVTGRLAPKLRSVSRVARLVGRSVAVFRSEGMPGVRVRAMALAQRKLEQHGLGRLLPASIRQRSSLLEFWVAEANNAGSNKKLLVVDLPRGELVQAYKAADLFVFASNIEYSPLVLFESVAGGTPFLSVPVGNAEEIAAWTGGGCICPAPKDERGYTRVDPGVLAESIVKLMQTPDLLATLGSTGYKTWKEKYTWAALAARYEELLRGVDQERA